MENKGLPLEDSMRFLFSSFLDIWDGVEILPESQDGKEEKEDYLHRSERLGGLARERFKKRQSQWLGDAEEKLFGFQPNGISTYTELISRISRVFTRPLLRTMEMEDDESAKTLIESVCSKHCDPPPFSISISMTPYESSSYRGYVNACLSKTALKDVDKGTEQVVSVTFTESGFKPMTVIGLKNALLSKKDKLWWNETHVSDVADFISALIVWRYVSDMLMLYHSYRNGVYVPTGAELSVFKKIEECKKQIVSGLLDSNYYIFNCPSHLNCAEDFSILEFAKTAALQCETHALDGLYPGFLEDMNQRWSRTDTARIIYRKNLAKESTPSLLCSNFFTATNIILLFMLEEYSHFPYHAFMYKATSSVELYFSMLQGLTSLRSTKTYDSPVMEFLKTVFLQIACGKREIATEMSYYREMEVEHARSFETKKFISQKVLAEMEASDFNNFFGFVEFDTEVDVKKAVEIAKEFRAIKDKYLARYDLSENQLRFRKLGNHKASGLYYPMLKCLCVDISSPRSFIHELGHLIDYAGGESDSASFYPVKSAYIKHIDSMMEKDTTFKQRMKGRSKYGYGYFTTPTEIFARAFELYFAVCLGVSTSITPIPGELDKGIYPMEESMIALIKNYFDNLLGIKDIAEVA